MRSSLVIPFLLLLLSCGGKDEKKVYEQNIDIPDAKWVRSNVLTFQFKIEDPSKAYNFYYNIRNKKEYAYSNLYLKYFLEDTSGNVILSKENQMFLFDPKTGKPIAETQSGGSLEGIFQHQYKIIIGKKLFDKAGMYQFRVQQIMRDNDPLENILSIGLRVEEATQN